MLEVRELKGSQQCYPHLLPLCSPHHILRASWQKVHRHFSGMSC